MRLRLTTSECCATQCNGSISVEEVQKWVASGNSTKRIVDTSEVGYVVTFLASLRSIAISGEVLPDDGPYVEV